MYGSATNLATAEHDGQNAQHLCVKVGTCLKFIDLANIIYVQAAGNYVGITMITGETVHTKESISHIAKRLPDHLFIRIHRSYLVNLAYVKEIRPRQNNYEFTLTCDTCLLTGTTYRKLIHQRFSINHVQASLPPMTA